MASVAPPKARMHEAEVGGPMLRQRKSSGLQQRPRKNQRTGRQVGRQMEKCVKQLNDRFRAQAGRASLRNIEIGEEEQRARRRDKSDASNQSLQFSLVEAIEEIMRGDHVEASRIALSQPLQYIGLHKLHPTRIHSTRFQPLASLPNHAGTAFDADHLHMRIAAQEFDQITAGPFSQDESFPAMGRIREKPHPRRLKQPTGKEPFHAPVKRSQGVETHDSTFTGRQT